ncbi:hypothetical protein [Actinomadura roseirufa]|uniref:hypothetical protein n=1 Tax=Actinomadura roseirufa TaxID=2094049 RepID=UPI001040F8DF|nr:hypothetical protein [Actinomadura roseirufa]
MTRPDDLPDPPGSREPFPAMDETTAERPSQHAVERERGRAGGDPQLVFTNVLLSVVSAYGVTGSVTMTVAAAAFALFVTIIVARLR